MADILHDLPIAAPAAAVFTAISSPAGLDAWWTLGATGEARVGADYELFFGEEYDWRARVTRCAAATRRVVCCRANDPRVTRVRVGIAIV